jgi:hypothetical protein
MQHKREGDGNMCDNMSEYVKKFYDLQAEATKEVMRMSFFLNYGGIAATLTAFGSSVFQAQKCALLVCLFIFILGLAFAIFMALELRTFAYNMFSKAVNASSEISLKGVAQNQRGRRTVYIFCVLSLIFFGLGISVGFIMLLNSM